MSSDTEHLALANRFQAALELLLVNVDDFAEVIAITAYYKAMHVVEAVFHQDSTISHCHNHHERLEILGRRSYRRYGSLYRPLRNLWGASEVARYLVLRNDLSPGIISRHSHFSDYIDASRIQADLLDRNLIPLERDAVRLLGTASVALQQYTSAVPTPTPTPSP